MEREASENAVDGSDRIEELPDDLALPASGTVATSRAVDEAGESSRDVESEPVPAEPEAATKSK